MGRRSDVSRDVRAPSPRSRHGWIRHDGGGSVERGSGGRPLRPLAEGREQADDTYLALTPPLSVLLSWAGRP